MTDHDGKRDTGRAVGNHEVWQKRAIAARELEIRKSLTVPKKRRGRRKKYIRRRKN